MAIFTFDLEAAINAIATLESAMTPPAGGQLVNSLTFGNNIQQIDDPENLPLAVHLTRAIEEPAGGPRRTIGSKFWRDFRITSVVLIVESKPDSYPADERISSLYWEPVIETFFDLDNQDTIKVAAGAGCIRYDFEPDNPFFNIRQWPPRPMAPLRWYWSFQYDHVLRLQGG